MRIFVLYCLFLFPLSYVIAKNGYVEQNSVKYHFLTEQDTLYIETEKTEFETLYRLCFNQHDEKKVIFELKAVDDSNIDFVQSYTINGVRKIALLCMIMWQTETVSCSLIMKIKQLT